MKEHLGGIYDFIRSKSLTSAPTGLTPDPSPKERGGRLDSLFVSDDNKKKNTATTPLSSGEGSGVRLWQEQKELNKRLKKLERRVADCEAEIEQTESAIAILEEKMVTPEGASDMSLYEQHRKLKEQLDHVMDEWETASTELEEAQKGA